MCDRMSSPSFLRLGAPPSPRAVFHTPGTRGCSSFKKMTGLMRRILQVLVVAAAFKGVEAWSVPVLRHRSLSGMRAAAVDATTQKRPSVLVIGGTGRIGTAVAAHLLGAHGERRLRVVLAGRSTRKGREAVEEVEKAVGGAEVLAARGQILDFQELDYTDSNALERILTQGGGCDDGEGMAGFDAFDACVHTAGPFFDGPSVLRSCINAKTKVYVDVADPVPYLTEALESSVAAADAGTLALVAGGAFPGLSNLLGMEAASKLEKSDRVRDLEFHYFTAGLGGSGDVNLYITNVGFGEPVFEIKDGQEQQRLIAGEESRPVDFGEQIGRVNCWAWPFPEGFTVGKQLQITGASRVAMGTAPDLWNIIMGAMVKVVPRGLWLRCACKKSLAKEPDVAQERCTTDNTHTYPSPAFSQGLASFSQPMVKFTDKFVGETHAIRADVLGESGRRVRALQSHASFRVCVGQSCAEFTLALIALRCGWRSGEAQDELEQPAGVYLPEQLFQDPARRRALLRYECPVKETYDKQERPTDRHVLRRMTTTPGTTGYSVGHVQDER
jgi:saccharopine dehydrogenase-like NADP-dependent oxidoreductase